MIVTIYLFAAGSLAWLLLSIEPGDRPRPWVAIASALAFLVAAEGVFLMPAEDPFITGREARRNSSLVG